MDRNLEEPQAVGGPLHGAGGQTPESRASRACASGGAAWRWALLENRQERVWGAGQAPPLTCLGWSTPPHPARARGAGQTGWAGVLG